LSGTDGNAAAPDVHAAEHRRPAAFAGLDGPIVRALGNGLISLDDAGGTGLAVPVAMMPAPDLVLLLPLLIGIAAAVLVPWLPVPRAAQAGAAAAALAFLCYLLLAAEGPAAAEFWAVPSLGVAGGLRLDGLSTMFALLITGIGTLVLLYAGRYLRGDTRLRRLVVLLMIFMVAMLGAVTADDVITLFIFWELTSLASFFLVAYDHEKPAARKAALQALLVTGGGGLALLAGLILVAVAAGTTSLSGIIAAREPVLAHPAAVPPCCW
jgi:multicomponent Na+:H+ antiporter subunit A